ncbi:hypothetical protein D3C72_1435090 [compost metagenome]
MQRISVVQHPQRAQHRPQQLSQPYLRRWGAHLGARLLESHAAVQRHHHISGVVGLPEAEHLDQRGMIELRQQTRFIDKRCQSGLEGLLIGRRPHPKRLSLRTPRQRRGHVLFDGHRPVQGVVKRLVDHAKTANPQQRQDLEFCKPTSWHQRIHMADTAGRGLARTIGHGEKRDGRAWAD